MKTPKTLRELDAMDDMLDNEFSDDTSVKRSLGQANSVAVRNHRGEYLDRKKMSESIKQKYQDSTYIKKHSDANEVRSEFMRNKVKTDEHKAKVAATCKARSTTLYVTPKGTFNREDLIAAYPDVMWQTLWSRCTNNTHGFSKVKR
jgi:hypothetical protein